MQHVLGARRGVRIVRHHDDGLALLLVQRLQQVEDLVARLAVEVAGGLVAQQERRIGDDRARDADALFLAARQLARLVLGALAQDRRGSSAAPTRLRAIRGGQRSQQQRQLDVALGRQHRQQVVHLKHEADVIRAPACRAAPSLSESVRWPAISIVPAVGRSRPPIRFSSVDLPEPDGPISARKSPFRDVQIELVQHMHRLGAALVVLRHAPQSYQMSPRFTLAHSTVLALDLSRLRSARRPALRPRRRRH